MNQVESPSVEAIREEVLDTLRLLHAEGVGPVTYRRLIRVFGSPRAALSAPSGRLLEIPEIGQKVVAGIRAAEKDGWAVEEMKRAEERGVRLLGLKDPAYPKAMLNTYNPPPILYVQGELKDTDAVGLGVVGARRCTPYGKEQAQRLCSGLARAGFTIISGLARGIDTVAHASTLSQPGGRTIAVLGNGLGRVYPPENRKLHDAILDGRGAIISELPLDMPPSSEHFPRRNRIIAGMSLGVLVVEGRETSGSLITARYANDMDREVFAVPGPVSSLNARGPHRLIKQGAKLVEDIDDILVELREIVEPMVKLPPPDERLRLPLKEKEDAPLFESHTQSGDRQAGGGADGVDLRPDTTDLRACNLNERERKVFELLDRDHAHGIDHLILKSGLKPQEVLSTLLVLEMKRLCKPLPGKRFLKG